MLVFHFTSEILVTIQGNTILEEMAMEVPFKNCANKNKDASKFNFRNKDVEMGFFL